MQAEGRLRKLLLLAIYTVFYKSYFTRADNDLSEIRTSINGKITFFLMVSSSHQ